MNQSDFMLKAVSLAMNGKGKACPNPCVGALIVSGDEIIGQGWHQAYGGHHAEVEAIKDALAKNHKLDNCTLYVTLEPCNHQGKTPPCTRAIIDSGIRKVVIGAMDPNRNVAGGGADFLRQSGISVLTGVEEQACLDLIADFRVWQQTNRAYLYLKMASTLDGRIATRKQHSKWVTSQISRIKVHELRSRVQAVIVGGNTFYQDNPRLTCRGFNMEVQPLSVVVTSRLPDPESDFFLLKQRPEATVFWTDHNTSFSHAAARLKELGCRVVALDKNHKGLDLQQGLTRLRQDMNISNAMCEGGGRLAMSFIEAGLADEVWYFLAVKILGDSQGIPVFHGRRVDMMQGALAMRLADCRIMGDDLMLKLFPGSIE